MALSKEKILKHTGLFDKVEVHVPAWADENGDDVVLVRGMTLKEFELNRSKGEDDGEVNARVIARCVIDGTGGRVFDDSDAAPIAQLPMKEAAELSKAIAKASGMTDPEPSTAVESAIQDAEGNSETTDTSASSST